MGKELREQDANNIIELVNSKKFNSALKKTKGLLKLYPKSEFLWNVSGAIYKNSNKYKKAINSFKNVVKIKPNSHEAYFNLGIAYQESGDIDNAMANYKKSINLNSKNIKAYANIAELYNQTSNSNKAVIYYNKILKINPNLAEIYNNIANIMANEGNIDKAIVNYKQALNINNNYADAYNNLGNALKKNNNYKEAVESYKKALSINPKYAQVYNNIGNIFKEAGDADKAIINYKKAIGIKPDYQVAYQNLANVYENLGWFELSIECYLKSYKINTKNKYLMSQILFLKRNTCDWKNYKEYKNKYHDLGISEDGVPPFNMLSIEDNPRNQMIRSINWGKFNYKNKIFSGVVSSLKKIKIGYYSADIHDHATMYLIAGLLSNHDKSKFEIYIFSYGKTKTGKYREFAKKNCRKFFDISDSTNKEIYKLSKNCRIDIAIDLKGYTKNTRSDIFSKRVAPIQINYLGYPGTMGVNFMDYIIADYTVIPKSQQKNYSEKIIYLPHSYQPNDNNRFVSKTITSKLDFGLPEDSFVFCCFNNNYKISPSEFDIWMRILRNTKNSVLWLFKSNKYADKNIINEAMSRGVDKSRIIFAEKIKVDEHLARHKHADLFLDTFNYNAHTTASDALWSGLPIVTKEGLQFASRVSASLLRSVGMEELITKTEEEYENLIMHLYENKNKLNKIRVELNTNNKNKPLFDTKQYTLDLEESFKRVFEIEINGKDKQNVLI